jgi:molecular chaperone GrpE (heat shock protein)
VRDAARRVGLTPFVAADAEPFDGQRHQVMDGGAAPAAGAIVAETVATGYTFQGRLIRPALVRLRDGEGTGVPPAGGAGNQNELPLQTSGASPT